MGIIVDPSTISNPKRVQSHTKSGPPSPEMRAEYQIFEALQVQLGCNRGGIQGKVQTLRNGNSGSGAVHNHPEGQVFPVPGSQNCVQ
jgi:hypothetical protein